MKFSKWVILYEVYYCYVIKNPTENMYILYSKILIYHPKYFSLRYYLAINLQKSNFYISTCFYDTCAMMYLNCMNF